MAFPSAVSPARHTRLRVNGLSNWALARFLERVPDVPLAGGSTGRLVVAEPQGLQPLPGPLILVAPDGQAATSVIADFLGRRRVLAGPLTDHAVVCRGRDLAVALEREADGDQPSRLGRLLSHRPVIIIDGGEPLGATQPQQGFLALLDAWAVTGTSVCISLADHPANLRGFAPAVAGRLAAGLVVRLPTPPLPGAHGPDAHGSALGSTVTLGRVLRLVADRHDLDVATLVGPRRSRSIVHARSLAMYLARCVTGKSLQAIGSVCGGRDHTTVLHATRTVATRMEADPPFAADVATLVETLSFGRPRRGRHRNDAASDAPGAPKRQRFGPPSASQSPTSGRVGGRQPSAGRRRA